MTVGESSLDPVIRVALARHYRPRSHYAPSSTLTLDAPHVVYTGTEYLVVWQLEGYVQYGSLGVQAARVSTNGTLVSGANLAIAVSGPASIDSHYINGPVLAAGPAYGAVYLVRNAPGRPRSAGRVVLPALDGDRNRGRSVLPSPSATSGQRPDRAGTRLVAPGTCKRHSLRLGTCAGSVQTLGGTTFEGAIPLDI
jgi:hypothetical protein